MPEKTIAPRPVYVIVGGSGLLGREIVKKAVAGNAHVIVADRNPMAEPLQDVTFIKTDITSTSSVKELFNQVIREFGCIDGLINTAYPRNANYGKHYFDVTYEDFCENISLNCGSVFLLCKIAAQHFKSQKKGSIVNIGSIYGVVAPQFDIYEGTNMTMPVEYAVIKAGQAHLTRYLAQLLKKDGVRVNMVSPGGLEDGQPESFLEKYNEKGGVKGMLSASDIVDTILYLLSDSSQYITGQNIIVDDGWTL